MDAVLLQVILGVGGVVLALLGLGIHRGSAWLTANTQSKRVADVWRRLDDVAPRIVNEIYQSYVDPLKKSGRWNKESAHQAKEAAVNRMRAYVGIEGLRILMYVLGFDDETLDNFLGTFVESAVRDSKPLFPESSPTPLPAPAAP